MKAWHILILVLGMAFGVAGCEGEKPGKAKTAQSADKGKASASVPVAEASAGEASVPLVPASLPPNAAEEAKVIADVINRQVAAMNRQDIKGILAPMDPRKQSLKMLAKDELVRSFAQWKLHTKIESAKLVGLEGDKALVRYIQTTRRVSGPPTFRDHMLMGVHQLEKINGQWYIILTEPLDVRYFDGKSAPSSTVKK